MPAKQWTWQPVSGLGRVLKMGEVRVRRGQVFETEGDVATDLVVERGGTATVGGSVHGRLTAVGKAVVMKDALGDVVAGNGGRVVVMGNACGDVTVGARGNVVVGGKASGKIASRSLVVGFTYRPLQFERPKTT